ncbi:unnamed protein product, partial [marine sediment metagenome]
GHPLKKATQPFRFYSRLHLKELTGLKASNLTELLDILKKVPGAVIYYHTHHFLEQPTIGNQDNIAIETSYPGVSPVHINNRTALPGFQSYEVTDFDLLPLG